MLEKSAVFLCICVEDDCYCILISLEYKILNIFTIIRYFQIGSHSVDKLSSCESYKAFSTNSCSHYIIQSISITQDIPYQGLITFITYITVFGMVCMYCNVSETGSKESL